MFVLVLNKKEFFIKWAYCK